MSSSNRESIPAGHALNWLPWNSSNRFGLQFSSGRPQQEYLTEIKVAPVPSRPSTNPLPVSGPCLQRHFSLLDPECHNLVVWAVWEQNYGNWIILEHWSGAADDLIMWVCLGEVRVRSLHVSRCVTTGHSNRARDGTQVVPVLVSARHIILADCLSLISYVLIMRQMSCSHYTTQLSAPLVFPPSRASVPPRVISQSSVVHLAGTAVETNSEFVRGTKQPCCPQGTKHQSRANTWRTHASATAAIISTRQYVTLNSCTITQREILTLPLNKVIQQ